MDYAYVDKARDSGCQGAGENFILLFRVLFFMGILDFALMNLRYFCDLNYFRR